MLFISCYKVILFLRFQIFCQGFIGYVEERLNKNAKVNFKIYGVTEWQIIVIILDRVQRQLLLVDYRAN